MKKQTNYKVTQNKHTNTFLEENIIQLSLCVYKMTFKCKKYSKESCKKHIHGFNAHFQQILLKMNIE